MEEMVMEGNLELKEVQILEGHTDRVWGLAWNPTTGVDGIPPMLASCGGDKTVRIWQQEASSGNWDCKVLEDIHTRTVRNCSWSQSGKFLATSSFDATTGVWENFGDNFECISTLEGHENEVKCVAWNSSGSLLATCSRDKSIWIWEVQPGNEFDCVSVLQGHTQDIKMVQWHPSLDILVSVSYDNSIKVWEEDEDSDDWHCVQTLGESKCGHSSTVWGISFNSTGDRMATCSDDNTIKIWNTPTESTQTGPNGLGSWEHVSTLSGYHSRTVFSVDWSSLILRSLSKSHRKWWHSLTVNTLYLPQRKRLSSQHSLVVFVTVRILLLRKEEKKVRNIKGTPRVYSGSIQ